jgi:hypothetical protein
MGLSAGGDTAGVDGLDDGAGAADGAQPPIITATTIITLSTTNQYLDINITSSLNTLFTSRLYNEK